MVTSTDPTGHAAVKRSLETPTPEDRPLSESLFTREVSARGESEDTYSNAATIAWKQGQ